MLIYGPVGRTATLSSVTAAINVAAAADPDMSTAPETPAAPRNTRPRCRITATNISPTPHSVGSGRVASGGAASSRVASGGVVSGGVPPSCLPDSRNPELASTGSEYDPQYVFTSF